MPYPYPYEEKEEKKEFTFKEYKEVGLKFWQYPPFQFGVVALILLITAGWIATKYILTTVVVLAILFVFAFLLILSAYVIVKIFNKVAKKKHYF
ncbi:MAG: hypothetical protein WBC21_03070 [Minisyncoccales bacterium]